MQYQMLSWKGPFQFETLDRSTIPARPGVYAFTEYSTPIRPNPPLPPEGSPAYEDAIERFRKLKVLLYVGKATTLSTRVPGYRFRPYLSIQRRPAGSPPRHQADRHKGRALLHAQQFFDLPLYLWWAETPTPEIVESELIRELHPALNTIGIE